MFALLSVSPARADDKTSHEPKPPVGSTAIIDHPVAIVDHTPIWASEIEEAAERAAHSAGMLAPTPELIATVLDEAIVNVLFAHEATKRQIAITDNETDQAITSIREANGIDEPALDKALADAHYTRAAYREEIRKQILQQRMLFVLSGSHAIISDDDVTREYEKRKADKHDLPKLDPSMREAIRNELRVRKLEAARDALLLDLRRHVHIERRGS
jgi:hypothetical protein